MYYLSMINTSFLEINSNEYETQELRLYLQEKASLSY